MMKAMYKSLLFMLLIVVPAKLLTQTTMNSGIANRGCESYPSLVDSLYAYDWDNENNQWKKVSIRLYESENGRYDRVEFIEPVNRVPVRAWEYYYDSYGNRNLEISSSFRNSVWTVNLKKESEFDQDRNKLSELRTYFKQEKWNFVSFAYYDYSDGRLMSIHHQEKDSNGSLYDVSWSDYFYRENKLEKVVAYDGSTGMATGQDSYIYNMETGRLVERQTFINNSEDEEWDQEPVTRQLYFYDEFSFLRELLYQRLVNGIWVSYHKIVYFYKLDTARKVAICHNGVSICISRNALKAHLSHNDKLGVCDENSNFQHGTDREARLKLPFSVYPNPARERINLKFEDSDRNDRYQVELVDAYGKVIRVIDAYNKGVVVIERGNLRNGNYFLRISGKEVYSIPVIFN
jgi:hypothetical protein